MKYGIQNKLLDLSTKVTQTTEDLNTICEKFGTHQLSSEINEYDTFLE